MRELARRAPRGRRASSATCGSDRGRHAPSSSRCRCSAWPRSGVGGPALLLLALLALGSGVGCGRGAGEPPRHESVRPHGAARPRASRRRAGEPAHDGRRAHAADDASGDRGADRAPGGASPGESGRRPPLRAALGLDGRRRGERAGRRRAARRGRRRDRAPESPPRTGAGWRALSPAPSPARLERGRGQVDRVGAQARQAARAEPAAARRDRHDLPGRRRPPARRARRRPLRDHPRRRHAAAARTPPGGWSGKMAHPLNRPRLDPRAGRVVEGYARAAAARHADLADRPRGLAVPARLLRARRHRPLRVRRLRRVPGPASAKAPTPGRASTTSTSSRPPSTGGFPRARS